MEGMLNDLTIGIDNAKLFEDYCKIHNFKNILGKSEFSVQVLLISFLCH
jgi:hypothetical protein